MRPHLRRCSWFHSVLWADLEAWLAVGWIGSPAMEHRPSVAQPIVLIEWRSESPPVFPDGWKKGEPDAE
jgi:hypothetical protein